MRYDFSASFRKKNCRKMGLPQNIPLRRFQKKAQHPFGADRIRYRDLFRRYVFDGRTNAFGFKEWYGFRQPFSRTVSPRKDCTRQERPPRDSLKQRRQKGKKFLRYDAWTPAVQINSFSTFTQCFPALNSDSTVRHGFCRSILLKRNHNDLTQKIASVLPAMLPS